MPLSAYKEESFLGSGKFYLNGRRVGNVSAARLAYEVDSKSLRNAQGGGGNIAAAERISSVRLEMTVTNFIPENMAIALQATIGSQAAATVTDEVVTVLVNGISATEFMLDPAETVTVKDELDAAVPEFDTNGDRNWEISVGGVQFKAGLDVTDGQSYKVSYSKHPATLLEAAMATGQQFEVLMEGINDDNGNENVLRCWKWKPSPTDGFDLISEDYGTFDLNGELLADTTKPAGKSRFFTKAVGTKA